jgi:hypothetical protein
VFSSHESIPSTRIVRPPLISSVSPSTTRQTTMTSPTGGDSVSTARTGMLSLDAPIGAAEVAVDCLMDWLAGWSADDVPTETGVAEQPTNTASTTSSGTWPSLRASSRGVVGWGMDAGLQIFRPPTPPATSGKGMR